MGANSSMCNILPDAQNTFNEACCAFAANNNLTETAKAVGLSASVLRNMLNPEQPRLLTPPVLVAITKTTDDYTIWNACARKLDMVTASIPSDINESNSETFLKRVLEISLTSGDLSRMALEHGGGSRLRRSDKNNIIQKAQTGISSLVLLISDIENRTNGMTPFLSMGVDFIASGAPMPGLT